jgi:hypothetical protein
MNGLEAEKPQRLLNNAVAFYEASIRCSTPSKASLPPNKDSVFLDSPTVVCVAFAIEQFLKLLLLLETGTYPRRMHCLDKLFDLLPPDVQTHINSNFRGVSFVRLYLQNARKAFVGAIRTNMIFCWRRQKT